MCTKLVLFTRLYREAQSTKHKQVGNVCPERFSGNALVPRSGVSVTGAPATRWLFFLPLHSLTYVSTAHASKQRQQYAFSSFIVYITSWLVDKHRAIWAELTVMHLVFGAASKNSRASRLTIRIEVYIFHITPHLFPLIVEFEWKELCIRDAEELLGLHGLRWTLSNMFNNHHPSRFASLSMIWASVELPCRQHIYEQKHHSKANNLVFAEHKYLTCLDTAKGVGS